MLNELRHYWSEETIQAAAPLIEDLDLEIKSVTYIKPKEDIPLKDRLRRADKLSCQMGHPIQETIIISIHVNAAGNGKKWHNAAGWSAYTFPGHTESDKLATCLYETAQKHLPGHRLRTDYSDGDPDIEKPFYILKHTYCAAVLTENGLMDSETSLSSLESEKGKRVIVALHVDGIIDYVSSQS